MIETLLWVIIGGGGTLLANWLLGCAICSAIDRKEELLQWVLSCPLPFFAHFFVPSVWPLVLIFWLINRRAL